MAIGNRYIDLHLHSTNSDGGRSPEDIVEAAVREGMGAVAITDHNYFSVKEPKTVHGVEVIPGCEFSTSYTIFGKKMELHIVGLFFHGVKKEMEAIFDGFDRNAYIKAVIANLNRLGVEITLEELTGEGCIYKHLGRPQLADRLAEKGYAKNRADAMDKWIGNFSPHYLNPVDYVNYIDMKACVQKIIACGGFPILAHPYHYRFTEEQIEQLVAEFREITDAPLGMEVYYKTYPQEKVRYLEGLAKKYNLFPSASSDGHLSSQNFARGKYKLLEDMKRAEKEVRV